MAVTRFARIDGRRVIEGDWYPGSVPDAARVHATAYVGSSHSFVRCRTEQLAGVQVGRGASLCDATSLDIGPRGVVKLGQYALVTAARIICDAEVSIGDYALVSWDVVMMDSYRAPFDPAARARAARGEELACDIPVRPIRLERNSWVGFGAVVLPGVTIGEGSIVAARSVVAEDVPPYVIVGGNPARIIRPLARDER